MIELTESQAEMLREMTDGRPYQIVVRDAPNNEPEKVALFAKLNHETDQMIAAGFIQDVTGVVEKPSGFDHEFRVVGLTVLGKSLFDVEEGAIAQA